MTTIQIWEYQKEQLDKLIKEKGEGILMTYSDIIGVLIREHEEQFEKGDK